MLISVDSLVRKYDLSMIRGVIHVGAHMAEEAEVYAQMKWRPVYWIEMNPDLIDKLRTAVSGYRDNHVIQAALGGPDDEGNSSVVYEASNGQSSSLLKPKHHLTEHAHITFKEGCPLHVTTLDKVAHAHFFSFNANLLNLDVQGMELEVLKGAEDTLRLVNAVYTEVNERELYEGCAKLGEIDQFLAARGFKRKELEMTQHGWGDAFYLRQN